MVLATLRSPDAFGELTAVDGRPRSASATAIEPTTLVALDRATLLDAVHRHPGVADGMLRALGGLARRITEQTSDLVFLDLAGRLAKTIATLADRDGRVEGDAVVLALPFTQTELAEMVGGSRQSVNQILQVVRVARPPRRAGPRGRDPGSRRAPSSRVSLSQSASGSRARTASSLSSI